MAGGCCRHESVCYLLGMSRPEIQLPLWARWVLSVAFFASLGLTAILVLHDDSTVSTAGTQAAIQANEVGRVVVSQDQAPHTAPLRSGVSPRLAIATAIAADVRGRIASRDLTGPLQSVTCTPGRAGHAGRRPYVCAVTAASLRYVFYGEADRSAHLLVWCKEDAVAEAGLTVPLSPRCRS